MASAADRVRAHLDARTHMTIKQEPIESIAHHEHGRHELRTADLRHLLDVHDAATTEAGPPLPSVELLITTSESLECDGGSVSVRLGADGPELPVRRLSERRVYRTAYVTWAVTLPGGEG